MAEYRTSGHAIWDIKYHLVWITKYRYKVLRGEVAERTRELTRQICQAREVTIVRGAVSPDHVHMLVSAPPQLAPAKLVQYVKGRSSRRLLHRAHAAVSQTHGPADSRIIFCQSRQREDCIEKAVTRRGLRRMRRKA